MQLPPWLVWYKKPEYRDIKQYSAEAKSGKRPTSSDRKNKSAIPRRLQLKRILDNKTCSPMSLYDFYMYLKYIEFSSENLEFYIWLKNYEKTYSKTGSVRDFGDTDDDGSLQISESKLEESNSSMDFIPDPEIGICPFNQLVTLYSPMQTARETLDHIAELLSPQAICVPDGFCNPSCTANKVVFDPTTAITNTPNAEKNTHLTTTTRPTATQSTLPKPALGQRAELKAIVQTYLVPSAPKELNIPPSLRSQALAGLANSSDPAHLQPIAEHVYQLLCNCSHRNFVRLGICNGTMETICMATGLGIVLVLAGFLLMFLRCFVPSRGAHSRWESFAAWPMWWLGMSLILSGARGSCFFLLLFSRRQPLPWERFDDGASVVSKTSGLRRAVSRLMILDRKIRVKDVHLRRLQTNIVVQSLVGGAVFASLGVLLFVFLPVWKQTVGR
ncbi:uncharacterized protein BCR38DRAFT_335935 [Pseudomassariella vexata]|uniref:RGS domain-containing protein n=1 Tax=Pseudomassariella vexata TaxID=1141098 RepID=A0A1Y2EBQ5_9PEZI|nr:uncharacterized protein BCR38DRAFT_335935 [Pseudomassariella vexata]ORY69009.1 hypothetical protein BCR38DRAFT_335935 [Pseudomassariella vexata]